MELAGFVEHQNRRICEAALVNKLALLIELKFNTTGLTLAQVAWPDKVAFGVTEAVR